MPFWYSLDQLMDVGMADLHRHPEGRPCPRSHHRSELDCQSRHFRAQQADPGLALVPWGNSRYSWRQSRCCPSPRNSVLIGNSPLACNWAARPGAPMRLLISGLRGPHLLEHTHALDGPVVCVQTDLHVEHDGVGVRVRTAPRRQLSVVWRHCRLTCAHSATPIAERSVLRQRRKRGARNSCACCAKHEPAGGFNGICGGPVMSRRCARTTQPIPLPLALAGPGGPTPPYS